MTAESILDSFRTVFKGMKPRGPTVGDDKDETEDGAGDKMQMGDSNEGPYQMGSPDEQDMDQIGDGSDEGPTRVGDDGDSGDEEREEVPGPSDKGKGQEEEDQDEPSSGLRYDFEADYPTLVDETGMPVATILHFQSGFIICCFRRRKMVFVEGGEDHVDYLEGVLDNQDLWTPDRDCKVVDLVPWWILGSAAEVSIVVVL